MPSQTKELVASALASSEAATEALYVWCGDLAAARETSVILFGAFDTHRDSVEQWIQTLAEMHPELAVQLGNELRRRLSTPRK